MLSEQGHPEDGTDDEAPNQSETFVIMKPESDWPRRGDARASASEAIEGPDRRRDARDAGAAGRRLQLQPADQGPRRRVNLRHPRPDRRQDLRRRPGPDAPASSTRSKRSSTGRAARATSTSTARAARSTSSPTSIARRRRATASRCATSRTRWRARTAASWRRRCGRASGRSACASRRRSRTEGDPASVGRLEIPTEHARRAAGGAGQAAPRQRAHADQPRAGAALPGAQVQHRGARHGELRRRGAGARGARR